MHRLAFIDNSAKPLDLQLGLLQSLGNPLCFSVALLCMLLKQFAFAFEFTLFLLQELLDLSEIILSSLQFFILDLQRHFEVDQSLFVLSALAFSDFNIASLGLFQICGQFCICFL